MTGPADPQRDAQAVAGAQRCLYGDADAHCGEAAVVHVLVDDDGTPTMSCARHIDYWNSHPFVDRHPISGACGLPGMTWLWSWAEPPGRCAVEGLDEEIACVDQAIARRGGAR